MTTNPPKEHNFDQIPTVHALDEFFHRKYEDRGTDDHHDYQQVATAEEIVAEQEANADEHIHMPSPSYWPIIVALGLPIMAYGIIFHTLLIVAGAATVLLGLFGWALEPATAGESDYDPPPPDGAVSTEVAVSG
jgi:cytochrome c oxidase subunit 1